MHSGLVKQCALEGFDFLKGMTDKTTIFVDLIIQLCEAAGNRNFNSSVSVFA